MQGIDTREKKIEKEARRGVKPIEDTSSLPPPPHTHTHIQRVVDSTTYSSSYFAVGESKTVVVHVGGGHGGVWQMQRGKHHRDAETQAIVGTSAPTGGCSTLQHTATHCNTLQHSYKSADFSSNR